MIKYLSFKKNIIDAVSYIKKPIFLKRFSILLIFVLSFLCSGYCVFSLSGNTFIKTIISLCTFFVSLLLFILLINPKKYISSFKAKRIDYGLLTVAILGIAVIITMFVNKDTKNLISYVAFGLNVANGYLIAQLIDYKRGLFYFVKAIFFLTTVALFFWIIYLISNVFILPNLSVKSSVGFKYINYFFISFQNTSSRRLQSIFWEPGLYSSFLILALIIQPYIYKKIPIFQTILLCIAIVLTESTFGYICLIIVVLLYIYKFAKNSLTFYISVSTVVVLFFLLLMFYVPIFTILARIVPSVFGKMLPGGDAFLSFSTRLYSPYINILIFLKKPFFGSGIIGADNQYAALIGDGEFSNYADSQTSTTFQLVGQFGIFGLIPTVLLVVSILRFKKTICEKVFFLLFALIILNKEPRSGILIDWIILFLMIKESFPGTKNSLLFDKLDSGSLIQSFYSSDDNSVVKRNSILSLLIKGGALVLGFFGAPIYNRYFGHSQNTYGTWLALLQLLSWIMMFDLGLGNGLKNKLIENDFINNKEKSKELISATYVSTILISLTILLIGSILVWTLDISVLFKDSQIELNTLRLAVFFVLLSICLEFILKNVLYILQALQKQAIASSFALLSSLSIIIFTSIVKISENSKQLIAVSIFYLFAINFPLIVGTLYVFFAKLKYKPIYLKTIKRDSFNSLVYLSAGFFIVQISLLIINSTNSILISSNYGTEYSATYEYYSKFFIMLYSLFSMITLPYWAMIAKAKKENNYLFIKKMIKQLVIFACIAAIIGVFILILLQPIFDVWINDALNVPLNVNYGVALMFFANAIILVFLSVITTFLNGLSIIRIQMIAFVIGAAIKICSFFILHYCFKDNIGWPTSVLSSIIALSLILVILMIGMIKKMRALKYE